MTEYGTIQYHPNMSSFLYVTTLLTGSIHITGHCFVAI